MSFQIVSGRIAGRSAFLADRRGVVQFPPRGLQNPCRKRLTRRQTDSSSKPYYHIGEAVLLSLLRYARCVMWEKIRGFHLEKYSLSDATWLLVAKMHFGYLA